MAKNLTIYKGKSKKDGREFTALKIEIGEWTQLYFPKTKFEMDYIKKHLATEYHQSVNAERKEAHDEFQSDMEI